MWLDTPESPCGISPDRMELGLEASSVPIVKVTAATGLSFKLFTKLLIYIQKIWQMVRWRVFKCVGGKAACKYSKSHLQNWGDPNLLVAIYGTSIVEHNIVTPRMA